MVESIGRLILYNRQLPNTERAINGIVSARWATRFRSAFLGIFSPLRVALTAPSYERRSFSLFDYRRALNPVEARKVPFEMRIALFE
jgi:hypothetical protein